MPADPAPRPFPHARLAAGVVLAAALLLGSAGTVRWWNAWALLAAMALVGAASLRLFARSPALEEERRTAARRAKPWDRVLAPLVGGVLPSLMLAAAGLDRRLGRTSPGVLVPAAALAALAAGSALTYWAMRSNPFFSSHVRIQADRGHAVVRSGPYRWLRHPGYAGAIAFNLAVPLLLGAPTALLAGGAIAALLVVRTALEDATLRRELDGYADYAARARYRLVPFVW